MFEKSLSDLVRGIRNNKKNEGKFISQCIQEIKEELKQDMNKKAVAVQKLTYLQMLGYDMSWAAFNIIEVMSQQRFTSKRIGYLAAAQSFHEGTEVVMLATNLLKKDFTSSNQYEAGLAINSLANICTADLARDLASDIVALMSNSKPYIRKKAVLVMYKVFLKFADSLRPSFPKLKEKLDDPDQAVISAAVNVICELARKNPKNYLALAPVLFKLLTSNYNNWMLIKIIKLFGALTPFEPRLAKKLVDPLTNLINTTPAMSLIYECIQTCTIGMAEHLPIIKLCTAKLRAFVEDPDQNLKYLGLLAMNNIMKIHPKAVAEHRDLVLTCLDDEDVTIRMRALDLLTGMVTKRNLPEIVRKLLEHMERAEGTYRDELVNKIITLCSQTSYAYITDFEWYITVLVQLTHVHGTTHGTLIASQVLDVVIRVKVVRPFGAKQMSAVLRDPRLLSNPEANGVCEVLYAAAWIAGEFSRHIENPLEIIDALLHPRAAVLPPHIQSIYMHSVLKLFSFLVAAAFGHVAEEEEEEGASELIDVQPETVTEASELITSRLQHFTQSVHLEVQERACFVLEVLRLYNSVKDQDDGAINAELVALFEEPLNPVAKGAIKKVPIPEGLDLDSPINDEPPEEPDDDEPTEAFADIHSEEGDIRHSRGGDTTPDEDEEDGDDPFFGNGGGSKKKEAPRRTQRPDSVFILKSRTPKPQQAPEESLGNIPVVSLPTTLGHMVVGSPNKREPMPVRKAPKAYTVVTTEEMPEGAADSDDEDKKKKKPAGNKVSDADALSEINLNAPLGDHEALPVARHRTDVQREQKEKEAASASREKARQKREGGDPARRRRREEAAPGEGVKEKRPPRARPPQHDGQLLDIGFGADDDAATKPASTVAPAQDYQELGSPVGVAPLVVKDARPRRPRPEGEKGHRPDGERPRRPRGEGEKGSRPAGERSKRPAREGGAPHPHTHSKREAPSDAAPSPSSPATSPARKAPKFRPLFDSEDLRAAYELQANIAEKGKLTISLIIENKTDTEMSQAEVQLSDTMNIRMVRTAAGAPSVIGELGARLRAQHQLSITVTNITMAQKLKGVVSYEYLGDTRKADFVINVPVGAYIGGVTLTKEQFAATLSGDSTLVLSAAKVKLIGDFKATVNAIIDATHADIVQLSANVASAYGKSILGHHVAMLMKEKEGFVSVDIKCNDAAFGNALVQELNVLR